MAYNQCETALDAAQCSAVSLKLAAMKAPTLVKSAASDAGRKAAAMALVLMAIPMLLASML